MDGPQILRMPNLEYLSHEMVEMCGPWIPSDEVVECGGVGTYAYVYVLEEQHRDGAREYARLYVH